MNQTLDFEKMKGLIPVIVQHAENNIVLMHGFMNREALDKTIEEKKITFFSRTKNRLWTKGESSGMFLDVVEIIEDCDKDALLIKAIPVGNTCHTGSYSCFNQLPFDNLHFLNTLELIIQDRKKSNEINSYVKNLFDDGINKIGQKVGEEAVEMVIEAVCDRDINKFLNESADLLFHYLILLNTKGCKISDVIEVLLDRHKKIKDQKIR